jgi:RNA polymerase sigma-70 factor (ECF subfamily)
VTRPVPYLALVPEPAHEDGPVEFDRLFTRYSGYVANIAARLLGRDDHEVDDVVQDVFIIASRQLDDIRGMAAAKPWLGTVTVRVVARRRRFRRWRRLFSDDAELPDVPSTGVSPADKALLAQVYRVLDKVPEVNRTAWLLRHIEGEPLESVAELCGCGLSTAKRRITAAQVQLDEVLER